MTLLFCTHGVYLLEGALSLGQGYNCLLCNGTLSASLGGEGLGHACLSDIGEAPFSCPNEGKGCCFMGEGIVVAGGQMDPFFLQLVAIIHFIISMMKKFVRSLPNFSTNTYVLISIILNKQTNPLA